MKIEISLTQEFYNQFTPCDCLDCRNYYDQIEDYSLLCDYLKSKGINPLKPYELLSIYDNDKIKYLECIYILIGECNDDYNKVIDGISIKKYDESLPVPNLDKEYFYISFSLELDNKIKKDFIYLDEMIDYYNYIAKSTYNMEYFFEIIQFISKLEIKGYITRIDTSDKNIAYLKTIYENDGPEYALVMEFKSPYNDKYKVGACVRGNPLVSKYTKKDKRISKKKYILLISNTIIFFILFYSFIFIMSKMGSGLKETIIFVIGSIILGLASIFNIIMITRRYNKLNSRVYLKPIKEEEQALYNFNYNRASNNLKRSYLVKQLSLSAEFSDLWIFYKSCDMFTNDEIKKLLFQLPLSAELKKFIEDIVMNKKMTKSIYSFEPELKDYEHNLYNLEYLLYKKDNIDKINYIETFDKHIKFSTRFRYDYKDYIVVKSVYNNSSESFFDTELPSIFGNENDAYAYAKELKEEYNTHNINDEYYEILEYEDNLDEVWALDSNGRLDEPYSTLASYINGIYGEGHFVYLFNHENELVQISDILSKILTEKQMNLFEDTLIAYKNDINGSLEEVCYKADKIFIFNEYSYLSLLNKYNL